VIQDPSPRLNIRTILPYQFLRGFFFPSQSVFVAQGDSEGNNDFTRNIHAFVNLYIHIFVIRRRWKNSNPLPVTRNQQPVTRNPLPAT